MRYRIEVDAVRLSIVVGQQGFQFVHLRQFSLELTPLLNLPRHGLELFMVLDIALFEQRFDLARDLSHPVFKVCVFLGQGFEVGGYLFLSLHGAVMGKQSFGQVVEDFGCLHGAGVWESCSFEHVGKPHFDFASGVVHLRNPQPEAGDGSLLAL